MRSISLVLFTLVTSTLVLNGQVTVPVRIAAFAMNVNELGGARAGTIGIEIDRWSTDAQRDALTKMFLEKGAQQLLDAVRGAKSIGRIRGVGTLTWEIRFARQNVLPSGETQILLLTDRPMGFVDADKQPDGYPFTLIDLRIKQDGTGVGKASVASKLVYNKTTNAVELEDYAGQPVRIDSVKIER
jgi:hypothetical protein